MFGTLSNNWRKCERHFPIFCNRTNMSFEVHLRCLIWINDIWLKFCCHGLQTKINIFNGIKLLQAAANDLDSKSRLDSPSIINMFSSLIEYLFLDHLHLSFKVIICTLFFSSNESNHVMFQTDPLPTFLIKSLNNVSFSTANLYKPKYKSFMLLPPSQGLS